MRTDRAFGLAFLAGLAACADVHGSPGGLAAPDAAEAAAPADDARAREREPERERDLDVVVLVSVDGLRSDALLAVPGTLPAFERLRRGAHTLNARTDPDVTITLPNHTGMLSGRFRDGEGGHRWSANGEVEPHENLHAKAGEYVASAFDVAHDRGVRTVLFSGKPKFALYRQSYDAERGALDAVPPDDGRAKIDRVALEPDPEGLADLVLDELGRAGSKVFVFAHFAVTDLTAHEHGWDVTKGSRYLRAVGAVDRALGRILDAIERDPGLAPRAAVILTTDHGGGAPYKSHTSKHMWVNAVIPFCVWTPGGSAEDLYAKNAGRRHDPGLSIPGRDDPRQPIRNTEAGNVALDLLGLPPIGGSRVNATHDLRVLTEPVR